MDTQIQRLVRTSREVIRDCALNNGGIVAANSTRDEYPHDVQEYFFIWPRDAAFIARAALLLGMDAVVRDYLRWCDERGLDEHNLFWHRYTPAGMRDGYIIPEWYAISDAAFPYYRRMEDGGLYVENALGQFTPYAHPGMLYPSGVHRDQLQPDGNALTVWILAEYLGRYPDEGAELTPLLHRLIDGLTSLWNSEQDTFRYMYFGPWEEKIGYPGVNLTYDLAVCAYAMQRACEILSRETPEQWRTVRDSMYRALEQARDTQRGWRAVSGSAYEKASYTANYTPLAFRLDAFDVEMDMSAVALIYPTDIGNDESGQRLLSYLTNQLQRGKSFIRYPGDSFEGASKHLVRSRSKEQRGNTWPLFNFWMALAHAHSGNREQAEQYCRWGCDLVDRYFPEQITETGEHRGARPLAWPHALFVLAAHELGYDVRTEI